MGRWSGYWEPLDAWYEQTAQKQYTRTLLFSTVYGLMNQLGFSIKPSVHVRQCLICSMPAK